MWKIENYMNTSHWYYGETTEGRYEGLGITQRQKCIPNFCGKVPSIKAIWVTKNYMEFDRWRKSLRIVSVFKYSLYMP